MANVPIIADLTTGQDIVNVVRSDKMDKLCNIIQNTTTSVRVALGKKICDELCHKEEDSMLYNAARLGNEEMCELLLDDFKLDPNLIAPLGKTPLCFAAYFGDTFVFEVLNRGHVDVHFIDFNGFGHIHYVVLGDQARAIHKLMLGGAEVHVNNLTEFPLLLATLLVHTSCLEVLLPNSNPNELLCGVVTPIVLTVMNN